MGALGRLAVGRGQSGLEGDRRQLAGAGLHGDGGGLRTAITRSLWTDQQVFSPTGIVDPLRRTPSPHLDPLVRFGDLEHDSQGTPQGERHDWLDENDQPPTATVQRARRSQRRDAPGVSSSSGTSQGSEGDPACSWFVSSLSFLELASDFLDLTVRNICLFKQVSDRLMRGTLEQ